MATRSTEYRVYLQQVIEASAALKALNAIDEKDESLREWLSFLIVRNVAEAKLSFEKRVSPFPIDRLNVDPSVDRAEPAEAVPVDVATSVGAPPQDPRMTMS